MFGLVKKLIKNPVKIVYGLQKWGLLDWVGEEKYLRIIYRLTFKRRLNLEDPKAFTEKVTWYKLHWRNGLAKKCADKLEVREYVASKLGPKYLIDCYGCWDNFRDIDFNNLPNEFVLKPTNGSGDVVICKDKSKLVVDEAKKRLEKNIRRHFSTKTKEWAYYGLPYRIMAERFIPGKGGTAIKDYKFFCFFGKPEFVYACTDRDTNVKFDFFDMDWNRIPVHNGHECSGYVEKPQHFNEMLEVAKKLSEDFPHVRVDLYDEEGKVYFGELTFYHNGGLGIFEPDEWDYRFGEMFDLLKIPADQTI